jgi:hypothetical protein
VYLVGLRLLLSVPDGLANCRTFRFLITNPGKCPLELIQEGLAWSTKCCFFDEGVGRLDCPRQVPCLGSVGAGHAVEIRFLTVIRHFLSFTLQSIAQVRSPHFFLPNLRCKKVATFIFYLKIKLASAPCYGVCASSEAGFLVRVHPEPCLILSREQILALSCSSKSKFIPA